MATSCGAAIAAAVFPAFGENFMLQDIAGSLLATVAFAAVLFAPGYVLAHALNVFGFRRMRFVERSTWALACSLSIVPILSYYVGRDAGLTGICRLVLAATLAAIMLLLRDRPSFPPRERRIAGLIAAAWIAFVLLMLVDFQHGGKLYFSVVMADQSYRIAFTDAVVRTGIPPANPLYFAGTPAPMRYYYFWYVLCATVVKLAHVSSRQAFIASSIWSGFGLLAIVHLYTRHFFRWTGRQVHIAFGLLLVTGADLLPSVGNAVLQPALNGDIEWWSVDPVDAWPDSLLWVPHHVAGVVCCLFAFLLLWRTLESVSQRTRMVSIMLAAAACASAFGLSVYVAFGFALLVAAWLLRLSLRDSQQRRQWWLGTLATGAISGALLAVFLVELLGHSQGPSTGAGASPGHVFSLSVRQMIDSGLLTGLPVFASLDRMHPVLLDQSLRLLLLVPGLAMELGVYGAVLVLLVRARRRGGPMPAAPARDAALFFTIAGLVMTMFLSSSVITNNDFGYRAVMLPQFFLLLLTAEGLGSWWLPDRTPLFPASRCNKRIVYALLGLGLAGPVYGAFLLRAWLPMEKARPQNGFSTLPQDEFQLRAAFEQLGAISPIGSVVQFRAMDPEPDRNSEVMSPGDYFQRMLVMDANRQMLNAEEKCATHFGGDPLPCHVIQRETAALYSLPARSAKVAQAYCRHFGVQYLVLTHRDPGWNVNEGWPVTLPVVARQAGVHILQCTSADTSKR